MKGNNAVLLGALLRSTSQLNIYRYSKDRKKKGRIIGNTVGFIVLYLMIIAYCVVMCIGFGAIGLTGVIPCLSALTVSLLAFFFTFFKTNGYLFNFREYDMLMSLPFEAKTVAGCKFLYMYIKSLPWYMSVSVAMLIGYGIYARPAFYVYIIWTLLSFFIPVIPMLFASFIGFIITKISAGFKKTNIAQIILTFAVVAFCLSLRVILEDMFRNDKVEETIEAASETITGTAAIYLPAGWFTKAVQDIEISSILLLVGVSVALFEIMFILVGRSYREINSRLKSHAASRRAKLSGRKKKSVVNTIAFKEFKRITGSTVCATNVLIGEIFALVFGVAALFADIDKAIATVLQGAPVTKEMLFPAFPLIIYFFVGMVATTAISPSLEGRNYWIVKSLPLSEKTLYQGKMLFNMYLTVPFMLFGVLCIDISARASVLTTVLSMILGFTLCALSTTWGCVCGKKHMRLDWENEVEVVKQGSAITMYLLPNMFATMGLIALSVFLGTRISQDLVILALIVISALLSFICYRKSV